MQLNGGIGNRNNRWVHFFLFFSEWIERGGNEAEGEGIGSWRKLEEGWSEPRAR